MGLLGCGRLEMKMRARFGSANPSVPDREHGADCIPEDTKGQAGLAHPQPACDHDRTRIASRAGEIFSCMIGSRWTSSSYGRQLAKFRFNG